MSSKFNKQQNNQERQGIWEMLVYTHQRLKPQFSVPNTVMNDWNLPGVTYRQLVLQRDLSI